MATTIRFDPILPKTGNFPLNIADRLETELGGAMNGIIRRSLKSSFEARVAEWQKRPGFKSTFDKRTRKGGLTGFSLKVEPFGPNRKIWIWVSAGTKEHRIPKAGRKRLRIRGGIGGYSPKTRPGNQYRGTGYYNESGTFFAYTVKHPGMEPRMFEKHIAEENTRLIVNEITQAVARAMR